MDVHRETGSAAGLGRVKTLGREEYVERPSFPAPMSWQAMARRFGNRAAGRTRFPSVNALSEFLHGQGQEHASRLPRWHGRSPSETGQDLSSAEGFKVVPKIRLSGVGVLAAHCRGGCHAPYGRKSAEATVGFLTRTRPTKVGRSAIIASRWLSTGKFCRTFLAPRNVRDDVTARRLMRGRRTALLGPKVRTTNRAPVERP
jgi:hypothetical protein